MLMAKTALALVFLVRKIYAIVVELSQSFRIYFSRLFDDTTNVTFTYLFDINGCECQM
jgi:hypothetical protein